VTSGTPATRGARPTRRTEVLPAADTTRLYVALGRLTRSLRRESADAPVSHGLLSALFTLVKEGPLRSGELAAREGMAPPSMTKLVTALEAGGYVERTVDPLDGRAWLLRATTSGRTLVESSREQRLHGLARRLEALGPEQVEALLAALPAIEALAAE
jgi:DNA-binding MarR family transcriptional regulator